jgi:hypothetical protein
MKNTRIAIAALQLSACLILSYSCLPLLADTFSYNTASFSQLYPITTAPYNQNYYSYNGPSYFATSGGDALGSESLSYSGVAQASRNDLRAEAQFSCTACPPTSGFWGIGMQADWFESGAKVYTVGPPDLLTGIVAYEVTWNIDGTVTTQDDPYIYGELLANITQNGVTTTTSSTYYAPPLGPVTFYLQPTDPDESFDFGFQLFALAGTGPGGTTSGTSDFSNTASFASLVAVDANGNVIPAVGLQLSDGTIMDSSGFESEPSTVPEPPSLVLLTTALISSIAAIRRRRMA